MGQIEGDSVYVSSMERIAHLRDSLNALPTQDKSVARKLRHLEKDSVRAEQRRHKAVMKRLRKDSREMRFYRVMLKGELLKIKGQKWAEEHRVAERADSFFQARNNKVSTDTFYVARPEEQWIMRVYTRFYANTLHTRSVSVDGDRMNLFMSLDPKWTAGFSAYYRGISASVGFNPKKIFGLNADFLSDINYYNNKYGIDASFENANSFTFRNNFLAFNKRQKMPNVKLKCLSLNGYYVFNSKRFSYPAVFNSSWTQKRSAGSPLVSASIYIGEMTGMYDEELFEGQDEYVRSMTMQHISIGGGYGYNWVNKRLLIHVSAQPSIMMWKNYRLLDSHNWHAMPSNKFNFYVVGRLGFTYTLNKRHFLGAYGVVQTFKTGKDSDFSLVNTIWKASAFFGWRF